MSPLLAVCLVVSMATAVQPCCIPAQWEAGVSFMQGTLDGNGAGHYAEAYGRMTIDDTNKLVATVQDLTYDGNTFKQRVIMDYTKGILYSITDQGCTRNGLGPKLEICFPNNSSRNDFTYGTGNNVLDASSYYLQVGGFDLYMAVTRDTCVPIAEDIVATAGGQMMQTTVFDGVSMGIKDRSVFNVPSNCDAAPVGPAYPGVLGRRRSLMF